MVIRAFMLPDAALLGRLFHRSVHEIGGRCYSQVQLDAWAPSSPTADHYIARASDGRAFLVAVTDDGQPLAHGDLEANGHIDHLYCAPEAAGTGVATALYECLEQIALNRGLQHLHVEASEPARRFFLRRGFTTLRRCDIIVRGVAMHNYRMEKPLAISEL